MGERLGIGVTLVLTIEISRAAMQSVVPPAHISREVVSFAPGTKGESATTIEAQASQRKKLTVEVAPFKAWPLTHSVRGPIEAIQKISECNNAKLISSIYTRMN